MTFACQEPAKLVDADLEQLAIEIDSASDSNSEPVLNVLLAKVRRAIAEDDMKESRKPLLLFFEANCISALAAIRLGDVEQAQTWGWSQDERVAELLCLRKAVKEPGFDSLDFVIQCKILTNLADGLSFLGRPIEAVRVWDLALDRIPFFAMALGNRAVGLVSYATSLYDYSHSAILKSDAEFGFSCALGSNAFWDSGPHSEAQEYFARCHVQCAEFLESIDYDSEFDFEAWALGEFEDEVSYRAWCLQNRLFLSPLNDVLSQSVAAQDVIHLPSHIYSVGEPPRFVQYFNTLKQEYVTARYILFRGLEGGDCHFSDKDVLLLEGGDGARFGYRCEQLKIAYRLLYSIFDKVAFFLNDYLEIGMNLRTVGFRSIWWVKKNKRIELHPVFEGCENWPLRGLFFLSKDLFDPTFDDVALPEAKDLAKLRNHSEHRFVSLRHDFGETEITDKHAFVTMPMLEERTLLLARMAREALIYLSLAMHRQEGLRAFERADDGGITMPVQSVPISRP